MSTGGNLFPGENDVRDADIRYQRSLELRAFLKSLYWHDLLPPIMALNETPPPKFGVYNTVR
jgi:hypothetical protein